MKSLSRVRLFVTPWYAAYRAPPSMGFSRQEYWSGESGRLLFKCLQHCPQCSSMLTEVGWGGLLLCGQGVLKLLLTRERRARSLGPCCSWGEAAVCPPRQVSRDERGLWVRTKGEPRIKYHDEILSETSLLRYNSHSITFTHLLCTANGF